MEAKKGGKNAAGTGQEKAGEKIPEALREKESEEAGDGKKWQSLLKDKTAIVLAIALVIAAGLALSQVMKEPVEIPIDSFHGTNGTTDNGTSPTTQKTIPKMFLIFAGECTACHAGNSFELLLRQNSIEFVAQEFSDKSADGKQIIEQIGLKKLPALVIEGESISDRQIIQSNENLSISTGQIGLRSFLELLKRLYPREVAYDEATDIFVLQELRLDGVRKVDYSLSSEACLPESPENVARVDLFVDPYSASYVKAIETLDANNDFFGGKLEFHYHYLPIEASTKFPADTPKGNIETLGRYLVCADEQGFLREAENAFYARYCRANDNNVLDAMEAENCSNSQHHGFPIPGDEADLIAKLDLNYDEQKFADCLEGFLETREQDAALASQLQVTRAPTAVINCKYSTHPLNIQNALCKFNSKLKGCPDYVVDYDPFET